MTRWPAAALALALVLTAGACSSEPQAERDEAGAIATEGAVDAFDIEVGDCLGEAPGMDSPDGVEEVQSVDGVPCDQPHAGEVYALFDLPAGDFPGETEVSSAAEEGCLEEWDAFVGLAYEESELDFFTLEPTESSWAEGDREIACVVGDPEAGEVTGTLRGAAR